MNLLTSNMWTDQEIIGKIKITGYYIILNRLILYLEKYLQIHFGTGDGAYWHNIVNVKF